MAAHGWWTTHSVEEWLFAEGHRFDFHQAIRLLSMLRPDAVPLGEGVDPSKEPVRLRAAADMGFPASEIAEITLPEEPGAPPVLAVRFMGLAEPQGPLPLALTALVADRARRGDTALRDFLDLFHHRLLSLLVRARRQRRMDLHIGSPEGHPAASYLFALLGLGTPGSTGRMKIPERSLLRYAGLLAQRRSLSGLEVLLSDFFGAKVASSPLIGAFRVLDPAQRTAIGITGKNQWLGHGAVVGSRTWDQQASFELRIGPLSFSRFLDLLPGGGAFTALVELTRFYVQGRFDVGLRLLVAADEIPEPRLGARGGLRLGWTSWIARRRRASDGEVRISPRLTRS
jgi:type VI secretion system protein ImpH